MRTDGLRLVLIVVTTLIVALGYASAVDPTWIAGVSDNGDHDDVVTMVTDMVAVPATDVVVPGEPQLIGRVWIEGREGIPALPGLLEVNRGPPRSLPRLLASASRRFPGQQFALAAQRVAFSRDSVRPTSRLIGRPPRLVTPNVRMP